MIPNVNKGGDMAGLTRYLVDVRGEFKDGKRNVHEHPHIVGGDAYLMAMHEASDLNMTDAHDIAAYLDEPRRTYGTEIRTKVWSQDEHGKRVPVMQADPETGIERQKWRDEHVWHCSLTLPKEDGPLSNEEWETITRDFMDRMGFTEATGKTPARWVAVHHGATKDGLDHVHIAASMVREDGTRWEGRFRDFKKSQEVCRELESKHGLTVLNGRARGTVEHGVKPGERATAERIGLRSTVRDELGNRVRAAAVASTSEAEWVRRVREDGMVIKPYFASGTTDVVSGYRVALKTNDPGDRLLFHGGGKLANDLSLPRVRENWPAPSLDAADEASKEWQAAFKGRPPTTSQGRETKRPATTAPEVATRNLAAFNDRLASTPVTDRLAWNDAARDVSGALSAWAKFDPQNAEELRRAASVVARSAQEQRRAIPPGRRVKESPMGTAYLFLAMKNSDKPKIVAGVFLRQMLKTAEALRDYHVQTGNTRQAQAMNVEVIARLQAIPLHGYALDVPEKMTDSDRAAWAAHQVAQQGQTSRNGPIVPAKLAHGENSSQHGRTTVGARPQEERDGR